MILKRVEILGFRGVFRVAVDFHPKVNFVIGRNGTGKTTFVRLCVAAMQGDIGYLREQEFRKISLSFEGAEKAIYSVSYEREASTTIKDLKISFVGKDGKKVEFGDGLLRFAFDERDDTTSPRYYLRHDTVVDGRMVRSARKPQLPDLPKAVSLAGFLKDDLKVKWLPIDRLVRSDLPQGTRQPEINPINVKIGEVQNELVRYFSELDRARAKELEAFRNNCLLALLNVEAKQKGTTIAKERIASIEAELDQLLPELNFDKDIEAKFRENSKNLVTWLQNRRGRPIETLRQSLARLEEVIGYWKTTKIKIEEIFHKQVIFLAALRESFSLLDIAENERQKFAKQIEVKTNNEIIFTSKSKLHDRELSVLALSSGEKQFFILLAEALLERDRREVLVIDEPELSLHISWQNKLVKDIIKINPNAQLILATHSPDIVATSDHSMFHMEDVVEVYNDSLL